MEVNWCSETANKMFEYLEKNRLQLPHTMEDSQTADRNPRKVYPPKEQNIDLSLANTRRFKGRRGMIVNQNAESVKIQWK